MYQTKKETKTNKAWIEQQKTRKLLEKLGGIREAIVPAGRIDLLTSTHVIEVKEAANWKHAIGQVLVYSSYFPSRKPMIYLFGEGLDKYRKLAKEHSERLGIDYMEE